MNQELKYFSCLSLVVFGIIFTVSLAMGLFAPMYCNKYGAVENIGACDRDGRCMVLVVSENEKYAVTQYLPVTGMEVCINRVSYNDRHGFTLNIWRVLNEK